MSKILVFLGTILLLAFANVSTIKRISDTNYRYEFYTTNKKISPKEGRNYFWFKGGAIHNTEFGVGGELLHDDFQKFYHSNQLSEAGRFKNGLKEGYWKTWFENGILQTKSYWNKGQKDGHYYSYDQTGFLVEAGSYKNNKKNGRWINFISKDTLRYRNGVVVVNKIKSVKDTLGSNEKKPGFFKRIFLKKQKDSINTADGKVNTNSVDALPDTSMEVKIDKKKENQGFFKRVFSKKKS